MHRGVRTKLGRTTLSCRGGDTSRLTPRGSDTRRRRTDLGQAAQTLEPRRVVITQENHRRYTDRGRERDKKKASCVRHRSATPRPDSTHERKQRESSATLRRASPTKKRDPATIPSGP